MGKIVISTNISLDGVVQDPDGEEGFRLGGWFGLRITAWDALLAVQIAICAVLVTSSFVALRRSSWRRIIGTGLPWNSLTRTPSLRRASPKGSGWRRRGRRADPPPQARPAQARPPPAGRRGAGRRAR